MHTQKHIALLAAFVATVAFIGTVGSQHRAQIFHADCIGKTYGVPGCPLKQVSKTCGDGKVDDGEECDNGSGRNGSGNCSNECQFFACGDGVVSKELGEECEPKREEVYALDPETGKLTTELRFMAASCGTVCSVPACNDDGVCSGGCSREFKKSCVESSSASSATTSSLAAAAPTPSSESVSSEAYIARCGNGKKDLGEQCDDGNQIDTDMCTIACKMPRCGDGARQPGEACDDGNKLDNDGCTNTCTLPACGDAIVQASEQCDTGGNNSNYLANACRDDCTAPRCGDHVTDNGEECDGGDSCTNECVRIKSFGGFIVDTPGLGKAAIFLALLGGVLVIAFVLRRLLHRVVKKVAGEDIARSIDDIPLDEIEMPWMKW